MHHRVPWGLCLILTLVLLHAPPPARAAGFIILNEPRAIPAAGQNLLFTVTASGFATPRTAQVLFRSPGQTDYTTLPMTEEAPDLFTAELPASEISPDGIEFYIEIQTATDRVTHPEGSPDTAPVHLQPSPRDSGLPTLAFPDMNNTDAPQRRVTITASLPAQTLTPGPDTVRMAIDDIDVTPLCAITESAISYTPDAEFDYGRHHVIVEVLGQDGTPLPQEHWYFSVPQTGLFDKASASVQVDTTLGTTALEDDRSSNPDWTVQSAATLATMMEKDGFRISLDANGWYAEDDLGQEQDPFSLNSWLLKMEYDRQSLSLGDISVELPALAGGSLARRGGLLELQTDSTTARAFVVRSGTVADIDHSLPNEPQQRYAGATITHSFPVHDLALSATALTGRNTAVEDYDAGSLVPGTKGNLLGVSVKGSIVDELLLGEAEYARTYCDPDTSDGIAARTGHAWRGKLSGRRDTLDYTAGASSLDRHFHSIIAPETLNNRREYTLYAGKTFDISSLTFNALHSFDNAAQIDTMPTLRSTTLDLGYTLSPPDWPFFFANANMSWQQSGHEPSGMDSINNQAEVLALGLSLTRETWSFIPSYSLTRIEDRSSADADSLTHQITLSAGWQPMQLLSINPSATYSRTQTGPTDVVTEDWLGTFSATWLISDFHNLNLSLSALDSHTSDDSMHISTWNADAQYNWIIGGAFLESVTRTVALRATYANTCDHLTGDNDEHYAALLSLNLSIPVSWP